MLGDAIGDYDSLDARLDAISSASSPAHASSHIHGGSDVIDGDRLDVDFSPANYTRTPGSNGTVDNDELTSHLKGIDNKLGSVASSTHASSHIRGGSDQIDGDLIDVDYSPSNYTRTTGSNGTTNAEELTAHLAGIDAALLAARTETIRGRLSIASANTPLYFFPGSKQDNDTHSTDIVDHQAMWGRAGVLTNFRLHILTSSGDADTATFSVNINGSDSALSISGVSGTDTSTFYLDTSQVSVAATDLITITRTNGSGTGSWQDVVWSVDFIKDL